MGGGESVRRGVESANRSLLQNTTKHRIHFFFSYHTISHHRNVRVQNTVPSLEKRLPIYYQLLLEGYKLRTSVSTPLWRVPNVTHPIPSKQSFHSQVNHVLLL